MECDYTVIITCMKTWRLTEIEYKDEYYEIEWVFGYYTDVLYILIKGQHLSRLTT